MPEPSMRIVSVALFVVATVMLVAHAADESAKDEPAKKEEPPKIYTCHDAAGNTVYQDEPCPDPTPVPVPAPSPRPKSARSTKASTPAPSAVAPTAKAPPPVPPPRPVHHGAATSLAAPAGTPADVLRRFIGAVTSGDRAAAASFLTSTARSQLLPGTDSASLETLRTTVAAFTAYVDEGDLGPYWSIRALRAGARPKWIFFTRAQDGAWKIDHF